MNQRELKTSLFPKISLSYSCKMPFSLNHTSWRICRMSLLQWVQYDLQPVQQFACRKKCSWVWFCFYFYIILKIENETNQNYYITVFTDANCKFCSNGLGFWVNCGRQLISLDLGVFCMLIANEGHILFWRPCTSWITTLGDGDVN